MKSLDEIAKTYNRLVKPEYQIDRAGASQLLFELSDQADPAYYEISRHQTISGQSIIFEPITEPGDLHGLKRDGVAERVRSTYNGTVFLWTVGTTEFVDFAKIVTPRRIENECSGTDCFFPYSDNARPVGGVE
ncbi:MAG TPA: hypothetical protein EYQ26_04525 [Rhodospirillales bacterium]|nr:hypothetical protein [Rhodospirillales bacterium]HIL75868.1 hypothetical protein [Rhodospirillales bacterium]